MIHAYKNNGYNIVLDVNSGTVHAVDEVAFDIIEMINEGKEREKIVADILIDYAHMPEVTRADVEETLADIDELIAQGKLFSQDVFKEVVDQFKERPSVIKSLCLYVAYDCNMACKYCLACQGEDKQSEKGLMSFEVGKKALDFLVENSGNRQTLEVEFFGGEPLLNWEVVKEIVAYGRELEKSTDKQFRFTLTTNGLLIDDEVIAFVNKEISKVVLSLDGRKEVNDKMRLTRNEKGTYDIILPKFVDLVDAREQKDYYIRGTYTHHNTDFASDILHLADLGFKEISMEPVVAPADAEYALTSEDLPKLLEEYDRLAQEMLKREKVGEGFNFYQYAIDLTGGPCVIKRVSGCGVGTDYIAVTPEGDLYPCHQFVGMDEFKLGNIYDGITNTECQSQFKSCNIYSHKECDECFARMYCSGGCATNAYHSTGSINGVYDFGCKLQRKRIECAIMLQVARAYGHFDE